MVREIEGLMNENDIVEVFEQCHDERVWEEGVRRRCKSLVERVNVFVVEKKKFNGKVWLGGEESGGDWWRNCWIPSCCILKLLMRAWKAAQEAIGLANSVLIVGGGPTGVELAGEIATAFPEKKITLVHRGSRLLEFIGLKASRKAYDSYRLLLADELDTQGRLVVDAHLRVRGYKNELKQGVNAMRHAELASSNLKLLMAGQDESVALVSLGKQEAIGQILCFTASG
ncbi:hypothetical protein V2J09_022296 [Rumex salicifolius]